MQIFSNGDGARWSQGGGCHICWALMSITRRVWRRAPHLRGLTGAAGVTGDCLHEAQWEISSVNTAKGVDIIYLVW